MDGVSGRTLIVEMMKQPIIQPARQWVRDRLTALALAVLLLTSPSLAIVQPDPDRLSLAALQQAARSGSAEAQAALAERYARGEGVAQDFAAAAEWRGQAAEQGHIDSQNALGRHYADGLGVAADPERALFWFERAAQHGSADHAFDLALALESFPPPYADPARAAEIYLSAAQRDHVGAQANLGFLLYQGEAVPQDLPEALRWLRAAAESGHAQAQNNLGLMHTRGEGVEQDYQAAADWFRLAADQGLPQAIGNLGVMYENGFGVDFDEEEATRLYRLAGRVSGDPLGGALEMIGMPFDPRLTPPSLEAADLSALTLQAEQGDPVALFITAWLLSADQAVEPDYPAAAENYTRAAEAGMISARLNLGLLHMSGRGAPQDFVLGYAMILQAAAEGDPQAGLVRDRLFPHLSASQINAAQAMVRAGAD
jgi:TPR repeat protein